MPFSTKHSIIFDTTEFITRFFKINRHEVRIHFGAEYKFKNFHQQNTANLAFEILYEALQSDAWSADNLHAESSKFRSKFSVHQFLRAKNLFFLLMLAWTT